jgi:AraC family transcriptional regulator of adaptative response / methylphosphotriester-DNA alkyltransferase methyltransferase
MVTEEEWQAVATNDASYDNLFRYAVKTTKIFCKPSCPSRLPKRENITIFYDLEEPEQKGYRPCKRCQPTGKLVTNLEWVEEIKTIIEENYKLNLTLEELSFLSRGSESYLRHVFKEETGQTPQQYLEKVRMEICPILLKDLVVTIKKHQKNIEKIIFKIKRL